MIWSVMVKRKVPTASGDQTPVVHPITSHSTDSAVPMYVVYVAIKYL
jgi:hypothetical protein